MNRDLAEKWIAAFVKPIYGFALRRCANVQDAEDLSQEIVLRAFRALTVRDDIEAPEPFIWTIAHNTLNTYHREKNRMVIGVPVEEMADLLASDEDIADELIRDETVRRLRSEIAYLSKLQRRIVIAYYFENKKQEAIARELGIPVGTVKWHLFEAKKDLKRGMDTMRQTSDLKFNPIKFDNYGINGSVGTKSVDSFFRSTLSQNICYAVRHTAKTVNEIADALGVSPVYVETEVEYLEEYAFLLKRGEKYIINFLISEPTAELLTMQDALYKKAAGTFAHELYDALTESGIVDDADILCGQTDEPISLTASSRADRNFILWALIPYIAAISGEHLMAEKISFDEVMTVRPDGGRNICHASVVEKDMVLPDDYVYMKNWCGPSWCADDDYVLWRTDSEWSERRIASDRRCFDDAMRVLGLYAAEADGVLPKNDYVWLAERGFVKTNGDYDGNFKSSWQIVTLANAEIKRKLIAIGDEIKARHVAEWQALKAPYVEAVMRDVPEHLRKMRAYELQFMFYSDGWFLCHCIKSLLNDGKLTLPTENQKRSLSTLIIPKH